MIDDAPLILRVTGCAARRAPDARHAELTAAAIGVVVRAQHLAPRVPVSLLGFNSPTARLRIRERRFDFLLRMWSLHSSTRQEYRSVVGLSIDNHDLWTNTAYRRSGSTRSRPNGRSGARGRWRHALCVTVQPGLRRVKSRSVAIPSASAWTRDRS